MCLFITAVVPRSALCSGFDAVVARHRLAFRPCRNPHVIAQLKAGEHYSLTSAGGLIGHWYQGDVDSEPFVINGRINHRVAELRAGSLGVLDQDTIHEFRASAPGDDAAAGIAADF